MSQPWLNQSIALIGSEALTSKVGVVHATKEEGLKKAREGYEKLNPEDKKYVDVNSDIELLKWWYGGYVEIDEELNVLFTYNPKSKWDWFSVGGRFSGTLRTKDGKNVDIAKVKDIEFVNHEFEDMARRFWEIQVEKSRNPEAKEVAELESFFGLMDGSYCQKKI